MLGRIVLVLAVFAAFGCAEKTDIAPAPSPQSSEAKSEAPKPEPKPAFRVFDAAAEKELKQFTTSPPPETGTPHEKFAGERWRFRAEVMRLDATEPSRFHLLTVTVQPEGMERTYVRMRSRETKERLYPGQVHEFEATFETYLYDYALIFNDGVIVAPPSEE